MVWYHQVWVSSRGTFPQLITNWTVIAIFIVIENGNCYLIYDLWFTRLIRMDTRGIGSIFDIKKWGTCTIPLEPQQPLFEKVDYYGNSIDCVCGIRLYDFTHYWYSFYDLTDTFISITSLPIVFLTNYAVSNIGCGTVTLFLFYFFIFVYEFPIFLLIDFYIKTQQKDNIIH